MNLLNMLMSSMTTDSSVDSLSQKTGASSDQMSQLVKLALPVLMKAMTKNASSPEGAKSLLGALDQHTDTKTMAQQIANADEADGSKIIGHILGNSSDTVMSGLASQTGMNPDQVSQALGSMAPALMSGLSAATGSQKSAAPDPAELMRMFGGQAPAQGQQAAGGSPAGMLDALLGAAQGGGTQQNAGGAMGMLNALLGAQGGTQDQGSFDGSNLLNALTAMMK